MIILHLLAALLSWQVWAAPPGGSIRDSAEDSTVARSLFDGKSLGQWVVTDFGSEGLVRIREGALILGAGNPMTGVTWTGEFPSVNYEINLEAMRIDGSDFFAAVTFPVKDDPCTLVVGGWGGGVVGLSSIDGYDASENETSTWERFESGRWYAVRLRVTDAKIEAWIDGRQIVDFEIGGHRLSVRVEVERSRPFGIATYRTTGALRNITVQSVGR